MRRTVVPWPVDQSGRADAVNPLAGKYEFKSEQSATHLGASERWLKANEERPVVM